ncbi:hypothetical protein CEXT_474791 [Caerostris extrusa]|uniref:Uncharacterized protein n=1 Tax=Caerostris extrusa TaxID=172846 RepID=A0AAV4T8J5_CAEEX|nr:hypothetical protein CEXT_474791 [Caerostris extrusa]
MESQQCLPGNPFCEEEASYKRRLIFTAIPGSMHGRLLVKPNMNKSLAVAIAANRHQSSSSSLSPSGHHRVMQTNITFTFELCHTIGMEWSEVAISWVNDKFHNLKTLPLQSPKKIFERLHAVIMNEVKNVAMDEIKLLLRLK